MSKAILFSKSVVFVDGNAIKKNLTNNIIEINESPRFRDIASKLALSSILGDGVKEELSATSLPEFSPRNFVYKNILINYNTYATQKLSIIQNTDDKKDNEVYNIARKIVDKGNLSSCITNIGINYELYYEKNRKNILKDLLCNKNLSNEIDDVQIKCTYKIDDNVTLILSISDAKKDNVDVNYISANFNILVKNNNVLDFITNGYYDTLNKKLEKIFESEE